MDYPVTLERDSNKTILVSFPDFPEAHTFGEDEADALARAADALATAIDAYIKDRRDIPLPSAIVAKKHVTVPALTEAKVRLYETMRHTKTSKSELARRLNVHLPQIDRLLQVHHASQLGQIEAAFRAMGKRLVVGVEEMAVALPARRRAQRKPATRRRAGGRIRA